MSLPHTSYFEPLDDDVECLACHGIGPQALAVEVGEDDWACPGCALRILPAAPSPCHACPSKETCH